MTPPSHRRSGLRRLFRAPLAQTEDPALYAALRILVGAFAVGNILSFIPVAEYLYGPEGVYPASIACQFPGPTRSALCYLDSSLAPAFILVAASSAALLSLGALTSVVKWTTPVLFASLTYRNPLPLAGDQFFSNFLFLLALSPCAERFSIDAWLRRTRRPRDTPRVPSWPRLLMLLQLCLIYSVNGWSKTGATYHEGTAPYYLLANSRWERCPSVAFLESPFLSTSANWTLLVFERFYFLVPFLLAASYLLSHHVPSSLAARTVSFSAHAARVACVLTAVAFHSVLMLLLNLGWFVPVALAFNLALFSGDDVARAMARVRAVEPAVDPPPRGGATLRRHRVAAGILVSMHATSMVSHAVPTDAHPVALARSILRPWMELTNTHQFWRMFSPDVPTASYGLSIEVYRDSNWSELPWDPRAPGHKGGLYVPYNRIEKVADNLSRENAPFHGQQGRYVCRTLAPDARRVRFSRISVPIPPPGTAPTSALTSTTLLFERDCAELLATQPVP